MDAAMEEILDGDTVWRFDREFLTSRWACLWWRLPWHRPQAGGAPRPGCCSIGADLGDADEARLIAALVVTLDPDRSVRRAPDHVGERLHGDPPPSHLRRSAVLVARPHLLSIGRARRSERDTASDPAMAPEVRRGGLMTGPRVESTLGPEEATAPQIHEELAVEAEGDRRS